MRRQRRDEPDLQARRRSRAGCSSGAGWCRAGPWLPDRRAGRATTDGIPEPFEGLGKGKALTAGNAAGTGYLTLAYNNDSSLGGLPVSLQVIKVECAKNAENEESPYRGNLLVIKSDNLFDEKLTLRHTGDFGGRPDNFEFEWWIAAVDDTGVSPAELPPSYPWQKWTAPEKGATKLGPQITIEGANPTTLRDNWVIVRYKNKHCPVCGNQYRYSALCRRSVGQAVRGAGATGRGLDQAGGRRAEPVRRPGR